MDDEGREGDQVQRVAAWLDDFVPVVWLSVAGSGRAASGPLHLPAMRQRGYTQTSYARRSAKQNLILSLFVAQKRALETPVFRKLRQSVTTATPRASFGVMSSSTESTCSN